MCGISGLWFGSDIKEKILKEYGYQMSNSLYKRGPDARGIWSDPNLGIVLSHTRLSIRDLSSNGSQPMVSSNENFIIIFNGEIYNFEKVKSELNYLGWKSSSDTEVLLNAIQEWGIKKTLRKCYGMFAFALWDKKERKLILAKDKFGQKPLYWGRIKIRDFENQVIAFSSDLSAIWSIPGVEKNINYEAFSDFLKYGYVCAPKSIQKDIYQLEPGNFIEISEKNFYSPEILKNQICWWDINNISKKCFESQNHESKILLLEETLNDVLKEQKLADVPIATLLSGGIDSSLITALLQKQSSRKVKTFSISFPGTGYSEELFDEGPFAKKVASFLGTDHNEIKLSKNNLQDIIPKITSIYSEPFADASQIATYLISKEISNRNIKVALSGDGADELFGGYNRHKFLPLIHEKFRNFPSLLKNFSANLIKFYPFNNKDLAQERNRKFIDCILSSSEIEYMYENTLSNNRNIEFFHKYPNKIKYCKPFMNNIIAPSNAERVMLADSISYLPNNILVKIDRAAMHVGLETRSPYLDERIARIAWNIKSSKKLSRNGKNYISKSPLKEILFKMIPESYFNRNKHGFSIPLATWLRGPLREWADDLLNTDLINKQDYLSSSEVKKIWRLHLKGNSENTELLWTILIWQSWINQ